MPVLDFKEIPVPTAGAARDQFELFAREVLNCLGFKIVVGPDRGADGGRDLIIEEVRTGLAGETRVRWLVSCKHKAHSGTSVTPEDEPNILDRVRAHDCKGFLGFYSTIPSAGLSGRFEGLKRDVEIQVFDPEHIEKLLLTSSNAMLARRFFPKSIDKWQRENPQPAKLFAEEPSLTCDYCGKELLTPKPHGIVVLCTPRRAIDGGNGNRTKRTERIYWCCRGACDHELRERARQDGLVDGWESLLDLTIPIIYIRWIMSTYNEMYKGAEYSQEAFERNKDLLLNLFPLVCRNATEQEQERIKQLGMVPSFLGGLGY